MNEKYPGDTITKTFTFTNESDVAFDPDTIAVVVKDPAGATVATYAIGGLTRDSEGVYTFTYPLPSNAAAGFWAFEVTATQTSTSKVNKETFEFKVLTVRQHYGSFERVKRLVNIDATDDLQDDKVDDVLSDADTLVESRLSEAGATTPMTDAVPEKIRMATEYIAAGHYLSTTEPKNEAHPFTIYGLKLLTEYLAATYNTGSFALPIAIGNDDS